MNFTDICIVKEPAANTGPPTVTFAKFCQVLAARGLTAYRQARRRVPFNRPGTKNLRGALVATVIACTGAFTALPCRPATLPPVAPAFTAWATYLGGTWVCRSGSTPYTVTYQLALTGHWIRGINTSGASQSEDMLTYDAQKKRWTLYDMEPSGVSYAMRGPSTGSAIHLSDNTGHFNIALARVNARVYHLRFLDRSGKDMGKPDVCNRRL